MRKTGLKAAFCLPTVMCFCVTSASGSAKDPRIEFRSASSTPVGGFSKMKTIAGNTIYVSSKVELSNADITSASAEEVGDGFIIQLSLTPKGRGKFSKFTKQNVGKNMASMVNGKVINAPRIMQKIDTDKLRITCPNSQVGKSIVRAVNESQLSNKALQPTSPAPGGR